MIKKFDFTPNRIIGLSPTALAMFAASRPDYNPMATTLAAMFSSIGTLEQRRAIVRQMQVDDMAKRNN